MFIHKAHEEASVIEMLSHQNFANAFISETSMLQGND